MGLIKATFLPHPGAIRRVTTSNQVFASILTILLAFASTAPLFFHESANPLFLMLSALCLLTALWYPHLFTPLNNAWKNFTLAASYIFITFMWLFYILPAGFFMQLSGRDPMRLRFQSHARTYWQPPTPPTNMQKPL